MPDQILQLNFSMKEIFDLIPVLAGDLVKLRPLSPEAKERDKSLEFPMTFKIDDEIYHLIVTGDRKFKTGAGDLENAKIRFTIGMKDLQELIVVKNAYIFLGQSIEVGPVDRSKIAAASDKFNAINGTINIEVTNDNQSISKFSMAVNKADASKVTIRIEIKDFREIMAKTSNPVNLFMAGRLKLEGDMGLALAYQSLLF